MAPPTRHQRGSGGPAPHHRQQHQQHQHNQQGRPQQAAQPPPAAPGQGGGGSGSSGPAVVSLQRELGIALDASQPLGTRCASLGKLHAVMASHQANRPAVAVAMLPLFLASWPQLVACLWDPNTPQLAAAAAPLVGIVGALVASSRAAAHAAEAAEAGEDAAAPAAPAPAPHLPPPPPATLLVDWLLPLLTGAVPLPTGAPAPPPLQALLCKTLVYALLQLPSCNSQQDSAATPTAAAPAPAPLSSAAPVQGEHTGSSTTAAKAPTPLLTAPVPAAAAALLRAQAASVATAVQQLLEAEATPPELLGPLLTLLLEVVRLAHTAVTGAMLRDLVDLLLGWSLEPGLQAKDRQLICRVLVALRSSWLAEPQLAVEVCSKLLADLKHLLPAQPTPPLSQTPVPAAAAAAGQEQQVQGDGSSSDSGGVDTDGVAAGGGSSAGQQPSALLNQQQQQQQHTQVHKLLVLLSCLVAILKATAGSQGADRLVAGTVALIESAHSCVSAHAAVAADGVLPDSSWSAAATSLAGSMLALWEAVVSQSTTATPPQVDPAAASGGSGGSSESAASDAVGAAEVSRRTWAMVLCTLRLPLLPADDAVGLLSSISKAFTWLLAAVGDSNNASSSAGSGDSLQLQQQQQERLHISSLLPTTLPKELWSATRAFRSSPVADLQAAAAATYTVAVLLAQQLAGSKQPVQADSSSNSDSSTGAGQPINSILFQAVLDEVGGIFSKLAGSACNTARQEAAAKTGDEQQQEQAAEQGPGQAVCPDCAAGVSTLGRPVSQQQQQREQQSVLVFDLVLLESWLGCVSPTQQQQEAGTAVAAAAATQAPVPDAAASILGACAAATVGQVAEVLLTGLQQQSQQHLPQGSQTQPHTQPPHQAAQKSRGWQADEEVTDQLLAVLRALLAASQPAAPVASAPRESTAATASAGSMPLLSCLELMLTTPGVAVQHQAPALQLLSELLQLQVQAGAEAPANRCAPGNNSATEAGSSAAQADSSAVIEQGLSVLLTAAASREADVRLAATHAASRVAHTMLSSIQQPLPPQQQLDGLVGWLLRLAALLASRCCDTDSAVAAAAQASAAELMLPLFLLAVCGGGSTSSSGSHTGSSSASGSAAASTTAAAAAAGINPQWQRMAALQPQQRAFKPAQLAQLFDVAFHASPAMLQRYSLQRAAVLQQQQSPQDRCAAQAGVLDGLLHSLPLLPSPAGSGSSSNSCGSSGSSSSGVMIKVGDLSSAAVTTWLLTQEAARQCVSARMRTHLGNPTQSFGALERVLQALLQQLQGDESPVATQRSWQRQLLLAMQAATPQQPVLQQQQQQQGAGGQQLEPQQLLQAPGASVVAASAPAAGGANAASRRPVIQQPQPQSGGTNTTRAAAGGGGGREAAAAAAAAEEARLVSEAAVLSLLEFMYALEVNIQAATEGSMMRPAVSKSVMAFFAGNKKVCEDWFSRTRDSLLWLSAAAGAQQHAVFHGMARLQELHTQLKAATAQLQAQQQQLQQERERQKASSQQQQGSSATATAASAAAAAAISGLGPQQQQQQQQPERGRHGRQQQQQRQVKTRHGAAAAAAGGDADPASSTAAAAAGPSVGEQLRLLQQQYNAALLQLATPVLCTLVLLADACVHMREPHVLLGLQDWVHKAFHAVWEAVSQLYGLDVLVADRQEAAAAAAAAAGETLDADSLELSAAGVSDSNAARRPQQQQQGDEAAAVAPSLLLLSWLPAVAAQAAGRYDDALQLYGSFLASEARDTALGAALRPWVHEQMAACYAAVADWEGLAGLCSTCHQQQQQQGEQERETPRVVPPWVQHWQLAGAVGVRHLQAWCVPPSSSSPQQQYQGLGLQVIEQHLQPGGRGSRDGSSRGSRGQPHGAGRGAAAAGGADAASSPSIISPALQRLVGLDLQQGCFPAGTVSSSALAVLRATAALEVCAAGSGSGQDDEQQQQPLSPRRGRGARSRGRGRLSTHTVADKQRGSTADEQHEQVLGLVLQEVQQQLQNLRHNPLIVCPAVSALASGMAGVAKAGGGGSAVRELALMQLLHSQLAKAMLLQQQQHAPTGAADSAHPAPTELQSTHQLSQLLGLLGSGSDHTSLPSSSSINSRISTAGGVWCAGLRQDGSLAGSMLRDVGDATAILQCLIPSAHSPANSSSSSSALTAARQLVLREAVLAAHSSGCTRTMQHLLLQAESGCAGSTSDSSDVMWQQLIASKLRMQQRQQPAAVAAACVDAHLQILPQHLTALAAGSPPTVSSNASASAAAAAYLSLAATVQQASQSCSFTELCSACPALQCTDWHAVYASSLQHLPGPLPCSHVVLEEAGATAGNPVVTQQQQQVLLACSAAATAMLPQHYTPWKAHGDLLYELAGAAAAAPALSESADGTTSLSQGMQQQQQGKESAWLFGAAAEAYCQHLAAWANSRALTSPQQCLRVLLKLLQIILQQGEQLHAQLADALACCPAASWQVLTNQLLAQLQHSSTAVRGLIQQLLQGLAAVVPCAVLYPLVVEVRAAQEAGQEAPPELSAVVSQLQRVQPRMMADTVAMADALEGLTVTRWEAWAGLLVELSLETNRKLLSLRADVARQDQQHLTPERRVELFMSRYNTVMMPVISSLQQHVSAATSSDPVSPDDASFRQQMLPQLSELLDSLKAPPAELLKLASGEQSDDDDSEDSEEEGGGVAAMPMPPAADGAGNSKSTKQGSGSSPRKGAAAASGPSAARGRSGRSCTATAAAGQSVVAGGWPLLKQLRQQLQQHLRRQQHLQLAAVAPQLSKLRNTAIPLPADDMTADTLPPLPLKAALELYASAPAPVDGDDAAASAPAAGASVLLAASGQAAAATTAANAATAEAAAGSDSSSASSSSGWLCIAAFDKQVAVLPTKTRPKRLLLLASDGSVHAFLLKGRDDLRVDERLMQFMRAANTLMSVSSFAEHQPPAPVSTAAAVGHGGSSATSAAAAAAGGWGAGSGGQVAAAVRVRPYSITPFGRRAGLVQWVRHTTSLFGLFRNWQQATAERYQAVAAAKRDAAAAAAAAAAGTQGADKPGGGSGPAQAPPTGASGVGAAAGASGTNNAPASSAAAATGDGKGSDGSNSSSSAASVPLPLIVAASRPTDAFYARLLPALQAAGLPVGSARSSWPASVLRSTFASLAREAPKSLLARQLLSGAAEPVGWWSSQQAFTASAAAGSIVGWILGLGDRHMDNLLLDRDSCELVHIDFSVCFDKGASLAVPEVVPFRLTQMMQVALGPGGLSGPFSAAAAAMLSTLRGASDLLCGLLQLLLSDSAVDWSVDREAHAARKDQDTAVGLRLCASRLEELRHPLLASLAAALPTIGNGLAAVVSYGEAHIFMQQLASTATAAHARAAAASQAMSDAAADEVRALTSGATGAKNVTSLTSDYRRLCGLATSCISSAGSWLGRHVETLQTLGGVLNSSSSGGGGLQMLLAVGQADWDAAAADRSLLLLSGNAEASSGSSGGGGGGSGLLVQALAAFLPAAAAVGSSDSGGGGGGALDQLQALLPLELLQHCMQLDGQGTLLLQQQQELVAQGRWSLACYAAVVGQLLSGGDAYIKSSHHWAWSSAFQEAAAGPDLQHIAAATATAPQLPTPDQAAHTWTALAACWGVTQLVQQQQEAAVSSAAAAAAASQSASSPTASSSRQAGDSAQLSAALQQLAAKMRSSSAEVDAAEVQYVASKALAAACTAAQEAATAAVAAAAGGGGGDGGAVGQRSQPGAAAHDRLHDLQLQLSALQASLEEYAQSGLSFVLDPSASTLSAELPEADLSLEELLEGAGEDDEQAAAMQLRQQQQQAQQVWAQQLRQVSTHLQLASELLLALQYEALAPASAWQAASALAAATAAGGCGAQGSAHVEQQPGAVLLPAGPVSQQQLWVAAAAHVQQHWQVLQQQLLHAYQLEGCMHALAAVAAAGGAAAIWPDDSDLMAQAIQLQQQLLPQGFDILTTDECVASAQLLQAQWNDTEQRLWLGLAAALCPLLGLQGAAAGSHGQDVASGGLPVLRQLLDAAAAGVAGGSVLHCKDVLEALTAMDQQPAGASAAAASASYAGSSTSMWGVPGLADAWKAPVVLLLQFACLQQQLAQQGRRLQRGQAHSTETVPTAVEGEVIVLRSSKALPLDVETQRPLLVVLQVLHELLADSGGEQLQEQPLLAGGQAVCLQQRLQDLLLTPLLQEVGLVLQGHLHPLQTHLATLAAEAQGVLARHHHPQQQHERGGAGLAGSQEDAAAAGGEDAAGLVPFDDFDMSLPGAGMLLEEGDEEGEALEWDAGSNSSSHAGDSQGLGSAEAAPGGAGGVQLPELVPFDAFDEGLAGAGMQLEDGDSLGEGGRGGSTRDDGAAEGSAGAGFFGELFGGNDDGADLLGGALEGSDGGGELLGDQQAGTSSTTAESWAAAAEAEVQALAAQLQAVGMGAAQAALAQQVLSGLQQVQDSCRWQQQVWLRHLAAFEWLWGDLLQQSPQGQEESQDTLQALLQAAAEGVGLLDAASTGGVLAGVKHGEAYQLFCSAFLQQLPPAPALRHTAAGSGGHDADQQQQHMPTSSKLLLSWQQLCEQQAAVADALQAWRAACATAAAAVCDVLLGPAEGGVQAAGGAPVLQVPDPTVCRKMLSGRVARAGHWLTAAAGLCSSLSQQAEASLQLEYSRRGCLWAPGMPDGVDAFQGNASLLQQLAAAATALDESQGQVAAAEALLASSQSAAAQAQLTIEDASAEAGAAEQQLALKTPAAIARAQGMVPVLQPMVAAAEAALPYVTDGLGTTLRALVTLVERNSAARDLAPVVKAVCLQHSRCLRVLQRLHDIGAAALAGLSSVLQGMQQWHQQQHGLPQHQQPPLEAVLVSTDPVHDTHLMQLLLAQLQPALTGVRDELGELGQAHILFTQLTEQLDSLAGAAETVAAAISSDHAMQMQLPGKGSFMPAGSTSTGGRKERAEARQRAFAAAALAHCTARLTGQRRAAVAGAETAAAGSQQPQQASTRSVADEVAALVAAATSVEKLSRMYEGWAAWL